MNGKWSEFVCGTFLLTKTICFPKTKSINSITILYIPRLDLLSWLWVHGIY